MSDIEPSEIFQTVVKANVLRRSMLICPKEFVGVSPVIMHASRLYEILVAGDPGPLTNNTSIALVDRANLEISSVSLARTILEASTSILDLYGDNIVIWDTQGRGLGVIDGSDYFWGLYKRDTITTGFGRDPADINAEFKAGLVGDLQRQPGAQRYTSGMIEVEFRLLGWAETMDQIFK